LLLGLLLQKYTGSIDTLQNTMLGHFTELQKHNVPISNVQLAKRHVKQVRFSHSSERQQGVRISYLGWQTVPGAHRCSGESSVAKTCTSRHNCSCYKAPFL